MTQWYQYLVDRLRALFLTEVGMDMEAQFLKRDAERKADLLRQAKTYEEEGFAEIAEKLREQAGQISIERPLASVVLATQHLEQHCTNSTTLSLSTDETNDSTTRQGDTAKTKQKSANGSPKKGSNKTASAK